MSTASYPPPPPFYKLYKKNLISSAPEPPPPVKGSYLLYGTSQTAEDYALPSLEEFGIRQIYPEGPNVDLKEELRSLNAQSLLRFLELVDNLMHRPVEYARKVEEIGVIFKNMHHILNSLRPHQARETIILILELQLERRKQALEDIKRRRQEAKALLQEAMCNISDDSDSKKQKLS